MLVADRSMRIAAWPKFSAGAALAAARLRSRCVFTHGCPVLSTHFFLGLAPHIGQATDKTCRSEAVVKTHRDWTTSTRRELAAKANAFPQHVDSSQQPLECGGCRSVCQVLAC
jgi:hypothetical protein